MLVLNLFPSNTNYVGDAAGQWYFENGAVNLDEGPFGSYTCVRRLMAPYTDGKNYAPTTTTIFSFDPKLRYSLTMQGVCEFTETKEVVFPKFEFGKEIGGVGAVSAEFAVFEGWDSFFGEAYLRNGNTFEINVTAKQGG